MEPSFRAVPPPPSIAQGGAYFAEAASARGGRVSTLVPLWGVQISLGYCYLHKISLSPMYRFRLSRA
jgi:hypothetical protein